jgi:GNAT superfamily N-acetyltransferase
VADFTISAPVPADENDWRQNWAAYLTRYHVSVVPQTTDTVWHRLLDPLSPTRGLIARDADGRGIGFCHTILHEVTWTVEPVCFLEDMFVVPQSRRQGVARALLNRLIQQAGENGWSRLYWMTRIGNGPARALYDQVTGGADAMVRYTLMTDRYQKATVSRSTDIG